MTAKSQTHDNGHVIDVGEIPDDNVGDIVQASAALEPIIDTDEARPIIVTTNWTAARTTNGARAIRVVNLPPGGWVSAAEAHWLAVDLAAAADQLKEMRARMGFDT